MATETPPSESAEARAFREANPLPSEIAAEDAKLLDAIQRRDFATFSLWLQEREGKLGDYPDPIEHAHLLTRAARIFHAAGETANAVTLLQRAATMTKDNEEEHQNILLFLRQVGGEKAVVELRGDERRALRERNTAIQKELIAIGNAKLPEQFTPEERAHTARLRAELQELINKEQLLAK